MTTQSVRGQRAAFSTKHSALVLEKVLAGRRGVIGRTMFGCRGWFVNGRMFAVEWRGNPVLRLAEADRAKACETLGARPWSPGRGSTKEYVEIPADKLKERALRTWLDRSMRYARSLPARGSRARTEGKYAEQRRQT